MEITSLWWWSLFLFVLPFFRLTTSNTLDVIEVEQNYSQITHITVEKTKEFVIVYPTSNSINPYRVKAWSVDATVNFPVLLVVRQERTVVSWEIPFLVDTSKKGQKIQFTNTSRTLCHHDMDIITKKTAVNPLFFKKVTSKDIEQNFIVAVSTSSPVPINVFVIVEEAKDFYITLNVNYSIAVSPSETSFYYYRFPDNKTDTVLVEIDSLDDVCLTVSIQDSFCPVFDLDKEITYEGKYQTVNRKGGLSIRRSDFALGFFIVFVAKGDNFECSQDNSILPIPRTTNIKMANRTSIVTFKVGKGINASDYGEAAWITLAAIAGFYIVALVMMCVFTRWGSMSKIRKLSMDCTLPADLPTPPNPEQISNLLHSKKLPVKMLARYPETDKRRSFNYLWHILSIAIFYSIPVVQLVITYQRVVNQTGDQDMCYYNFLCAHPAFGLSDFNHIFSNIGYVFIGILFLIVSLQRHAIVKDRPGLGIPVHYGLFYAMGIALIIEGLLSACYHICPSQSNYQFDTSFMYVMAVLCMVKLYQNRHPDVNATAYATFTVLGVAIFLAMVGILNGTLGVWILFSVVYTILSTYISFKIYFLSYIFEGLKDFKDEYLARTITASTFSPIRRSRFIVLIFANVVNYAMLITGLCLYDSGVTDFGTFLLGLLMGNAVLHTMFYTVMKLVHGERICFEAICYGLLMIATWAGSAIFFLDYSTLWTVTPAESRQRNQQCILMNFYDTHDVWHLLSAPALYFSFMYLLCLDDDLVDAKQEDIRVF